MDWDDIRYFLVLARTGSLSAAARVLGVTHVTVARRITRLETERGVKLFDRRQKGYLLSTAGERLMAEGEAVEESCLHFERKIRGQSDVLSGPLTISIPETSLIDLSAPIAAFMKSYPDVQLTVLATSEQLNLNQLQADVLIRMTDTPPELLVGRRLAEIPLYAYGREDYVEQINGDYESANWAIWQAVFGKSEGDKYFRTLVAEPHITLRTNSNSQLLAMVRQGDSLGLMSAQIAAQYPELVPVSDTPLVTTGLWILTHSDLRHSAKVRCFMQFMAEKC
ncbi:LysR family transcriptional regulator [uncultured Zhongshania sp.]|uniref:LysR family transcriptional regulator n=1 Tax=uncultured Zhongshania sp. TaxID=1642288 RepID=UPI0025DDB1BF|nr:LysR family transcriptional regulator [uncultured Zhongshania sp.]